MLCCAVLCLIHPVCLIIYFLLRFIISSWVKYEVLTEVGHFLHLEAPKQVLSAVQELVAVPLHTVTRA